MTVGRSSRVYEEGLLIAASRRGDRVRSPPPTRYSNRLLRETCASRKQRPLIANVPRQTIFVTHYPQINQIAEAVRPRGCQLREESAHGLRRSILKASRASTCRSSRRTAPMGSLT